MTIYINNKEYNIEDNASIGKALKQVESNIPSSGIAIALNNDVIPASQWDSKKLSHGDRLTIITAFYGG